MHVRSGGHSARARPRPRRPSDPARSPRSARGEGPRRRWPRGSSTCPARPCPARRCSAGAALVDRDRSEGVAQRAVPVAGGREIAGEAGASGRPLRANGTRQVVDATAAARCAASSRGREHALAKRRQRVALAAPDAAGVEAEHAVAHARPTLDQPVLGAFGAQLGGDPLAHRRARWRSRAGPRRTAACAGSRGRRAARRPRPSSGRARPDARGARATVAPRGACTGAWPAPRTARASASSRAARTPARRRRPSRSGAG